MAFHEFGLMPCPPRRGERFDRHEPEKYACVRVHDDPVSEILPSLSSAKTYWHTVDVPGRGLDEAGITLIPPDSAAGMAETLKGKDHFSELTDLLETARRTQKWIIHFGI